jgi:hypothetical protein
MRHHLYAIAETPNGSVIVFRTLTTSNLSSGYPWPEAQRTAAAFWERMVDFTMSSGARRPGP